jgi:hypothetical protein
MAYRVPISLGANLTPALLEKAGGIDGLVGPILRDSLETLQNYGKEHLSGVPFTSDTGSHTIHKRTGVGAASVLTQYPYGSPYKGRVFAFASTRYADNPETYNYLAILEFGRGEIKPRYTPAALAGNPAAARLTIPGGPNALANGVGGFRGMSGNYRMVRRIPPMEGKGWMAAAVKKTEIEIPEIIQAHVLPWLEK